MNTPTAIPYTTEGYALLHEGSVALARVESTGMAVDVPYIHKAIAETKQKIKDIEQELEQTDVMREWRKRFRQRTNINSDEQLAVVLFDVMGYPQPKKVTKTGKWGTDAESLLDVGIPFCKQYILAQKFKKAVSTNFKGILREVVDGRIHPFFNLGNVISYRSSSNDPNFQNQPIRDPVLGALVRRAFVASPGNHVVEIDFSGAEVRVGAAYHRDPKMVDYILDKSTDMHRDAAADLFFMKPKDVPKPVRHEAKSNFVFAEFYGSYYLNCAPHLWKFIEQCTLPDGRGLLAHMAANGVRELGVLDPKQEPRVGTFEKHVRKVEKILWGERFSGYAQWKKDWFAEYQDKGWFESLTGFIYQGYMSRNDATNYPIQGSSFHLLLWSLIQLVNKELPKRNMRSRVVGQIHDSLVADVVPSELDEFLALCRKIMVGRVGRHFPWLPVPMEIEAAVSPVGASWAEKVEYKFDA